MSGEYHIMNIRTSDVVERIPYGDAIDGVRVRAEIEKQAAAMNEECGAGTYIILQVE
jgi:hypothetical protein